ncbi:hypothetical protein [Methanolapillus ohkumae]|uniref:DUF523 domain-containing protein n=1 Tax=Methanolapillus ohkumae TaxID=3028298 RepID=A0AA96VI36_9EURY|nr:hypothetical protein MsAm2_06800 [Methanosarcinaceae archaeon Am2]
MPDIFSPQLYVVSHCLFNPAARVRGIKKPVPFDFYYDYFDSKNQSARSEFVISLPCPETILFGADRKKATKDQLDSPKYRRFCADLFLPYAEMIEQFEKDGFSILILGVSKSPSCGVCVTTTGLPEDEQDTDFEGTVMSGLGIFMEEIQKELNRRHVCYRMRE